MSETKKRACSKKSSTRLTVIYSGHKKYKMNKLGIFLNKRKWQHRAVVCENTTEEIQLDNNYNRLLYLKHFEYKNSDGFQLSPSNTM